MANFIEQGENLVGRLWAVVLFISPLTIPRAEARIRHYKWEVKYEYKSPDCFKKLTMTINGESPGPTILAQQGDTIVVDLTNSLPNENTVIHWHGIRQVSARKFFIFFSFW